MIPFSSLLLRNYYNAIGWNEDNSYSQLTRSSTALLDFELPRSLVLQLANSPTPVFFTSYSLDALPQLNGALSYVTTSQDLPDIQPSNNIPFKHVVDRFRVLPPPHRPYPKDEIWLRGKRVEGRDYLLYSRMHFPSLHLSGLATTRLTPTLQLHLAFLSLPNPPSARPTSPSHASHSRAPSSSGESSSSSTSSSSSSPSSSQVPSPSNLLISLQHDTGKYSGEYTYSVQDGMFGWRGLYNFGWQDRGREVEELERGMAVARGTSERGVESGGQAVRVEEVQDPAIAGQAAGQNQKGRFSAGAEVYFSAKQRSFGISTGMRYQTVPPQKKTAAPHLPIQAPTTLTILYNPLIGFVSTAYSAQVHPHIALSTRFGVNVYSYESDLTVGGEWWIGRRRGKRDTTAVSGSIDEKINAEMSKGELQIGSTSLRSGMETSLRPTIVEMASNNGDVAGEIDGPFAKDRIDPRALNTSKRSAPTVTENPQSARKDDEERDGVIKARLSGNWSISLLYEARIRNCLVSIGVMSDLLSRQKPIRSVGLEVQYFS